MRPGMDDQQYLLFHQFLARECVFAMLAKDDMETNLRGHFKRGMTPAESIAQSDRFWYSVDAFLMATGNISKVFWPPRGGKLKDEAERNMKRGKGLRDILGVADDSILGNRTLRNRFEHFDQDLDRWLAAEGRTPVVVLSAIQPSFQIELTEAMVPAKTFRSFDPYAWALYCMGDSLPLRKVAEAISSLQESLRSHQP